MFYHKQKHGAKRFNVSFKIFCLVSSIYNLYIKQLFENIFLMHLNKKGYFVVFNTRP